MTGSSKLHSVKVRRVRSYANYVHSKAGNFHLGVIPSPRQLGMPPSIAIVLRGAPSSKEKGFVLDLEIPFSCYFLDNTLPLM